MAAGRTLVLLACVCFLNPVLFQPMALLGFSAFLEGLNPLPIKALNKHPVVTMHSAGKSAEHRRGAVQKYSPCCILALQNSAVQAF